MFGQVKRFLFNHTNTLEITEGSALAVDLEWSAFSVLSIITDFEDQFGIEIPHWEIGSLIIVSDTLRCLEVHA